MPKKAAVRLWHRARDFDRGTHQPGQHGGALGHTALAVLHALIFDFLNHRTGRLDPSYAAIAAKAGVCVRTVASALQRLKALGEMADLPAEGLPIAARVRSTRPPAPALLSRAGEIEFVQPESGVSPGQACVFYDLIGPHARVLGGGFIAAA